MLSIDRQFQALGTAADTLRYAMGFMKLALPLLLAFSASLSAASRFEYWPNTTYDPSVPTEQQVLGYESGDQISRPENIVKYLEALATAAPTRIKVFDYAKTWEGRRLIYAVIGSEANIARLSEIQSDMKRLADPRKTSEADAKRIMTNMPALVWLAHSVHGDEISSSDAAMQTAYHLLAARNDEIVKNIVANDLVLIDPLQNPDGRNRFVHDFEVAEGLHPDPNQLAAEHNQPWPGGRTNHYYFDMNRDWFAMTQPETRGRLQALQQWFPLVVVDLHEMGSNSTYFFTPEADPFNPYILPGQRASLDWFGRNNAKWFDKYGFSYFTREGYDEFYPGYGASWPLYYGAIAMTYEQASTRGLVVQRSDEALVNYRDTVRHHFVSSIATCETAAQNREKLLENFYRYRQTAIEEGTRGPAREYIVPRTGDVSTVDKLAANLSFQGIEVKRATEAFRNTGHDYPAGSYVISLAQPSERMIRTLLDPQVSMTTEFLAAEERRRQSHQPTEVYDVTAWSIPLQYGIAAISSNEVTNAKFELVAPGVVPEGRFTASSAAVAYLVPWGTSAAGRFLTGALNAGLHISTADRHFKLNGRTFGNGTLILKTSENGQDLAATVAQLAKTTGAEVYGTDTGWVEEGVNFGSDYVMNIPRAHIAMAWDRPTSSSEAGNTRFVLERQYDYPVTVIRTEQLAYGDLGQFDTLLLPDTGYGGGYDSVLGQNGAAHLRDWVESGGTLIALGSGATAYLSDPRTGLLAVSQENVAHEKEEGKSSGASSSSASSDSEKPAPRAAHVPGKLLPTQKDFNQAIEPDTEPPDPLHGVLLHANVNRDEWVTAGVPDTVNVMVTGRSIFTPIKLDKGVNAAYFAGPDQIFASGFMWEQNRKQLAYKPFVIVQSVGNGMVIAFTADPNFRAYMDGLNVLFLNAVFRGPAHAERPHRRRG